MLYNFQYLSIQNQIKKKKKKSAHTHTFLMTKMSYVGKTTKFQIVERKYQKFIGLNKIFLR